MSMVSASMSTNTGLAPVATMAETVAVTVLATVTTLSPGPMPAASSASSMASVPLATPTVPAVPSHALNSCSKASSSGPRM